MSDATKYCYETQKLHTIVWDTRTYILLQVYFIR